jgi:predicted O-linked N-acetylglucosamine transferase (SPINDLY family)
MTAELSTLLRRGLAAHEGNRPDEAEKIYRRVLSLSPDNAEAEHLLATLLTRTGRHDEALELFESCLTRMGANPAARCNYAIALETSGQIERAIEEFRLAISYHGDFPTALYHLARLEKSRGNYGQTVDLLGRLLNLHQGHFDAFLLFGEALHALGQHEAALKSFDSAAETAGLDYEKINRTGEILLRLLYLQQAQILFQRALSIRPTHVASLINLAISLIHQGQLGKAMALLRTAKGLAPENPEIDGHLADIDIRAGDAAQGAAKLSELVEKYPARADFHARLLAALLYLPQFDGPEYLKQAKQWARSHLPPQTVTPKFANRRTNDRRLRIGWISTDFHDHPMSKRLMGLARHQNRNETELFLYAAVARPDDVTRQWQAIADGWREVYGQSPQQIAERIRKDRVDILVDLSGYAKNQPLEVFALRAAPVQATLYRASTGIAQMDYFFCHPEGLPSGVAENRICSETILRLPTTTIAYSPPADSAAVSPLPALLNAHVTFGYSGTLPRISDPVLHCWARIMNKVAGSKMIIHGDGLEDAYARKTFLDRARQAGLHPDRLELQGAIRNCDQAASVFTRIDIGLDPFPANNLETACDMLWHGVPFITLAGQTPPARAGLSLLCDVGLDALAAETQKGYVEKAVLMSKDIEALSTIRRTLRDRMLAAPLCNHRKIAAGFEDAYREMWKTWCAL